MHDPLSWGYRYLAVAPEHFRVDYRINPFMDPADQPDMPRARAQWDHLVAAIERLGAAVGVVPAAAGAPDMVYAMNLGLGIENAAGGRHMVLSHMRHPERRVETGIVQGWLDRSGCTASYVGRDGVGPHFEAGDAFAFGGELLVGYGPRTEELALKSLARDLEVRVRGFRLVHPAMYHFDLAFCPLGAGRAIVCPSAFDDASAAALLDLVPEPLVITEEEALTTFCANSIAIGWSVVMPGCPDRVRGALEAWGLEVVVADVSEFHKGGGSVRCLTNPVDLRLGRDLEIVPGGEVAVYSPGGVGSQASW